MPIKKTGNEHFDRLWAEWLGMTGNGSRKHDARKNFEKRCRKDDPERIANEIIIAFRKKNEARKQKEEKEGWAESWCALAVFLNQERDEDDYADDVPKKEKAIIYCNNHPASESVYGRPPFLCAECISREAMKVDPVVAMMRQYSKDNNIGKMSRKEMIELRDRNLDRFMEKVK